MGITVVRLGGEGAGVWAKAWVEVESSTFLLHLILCKQGQIANISDLPLTQLLSLEQYWT